MTGPVRSPFLQWLVLVGVLFFGWVVAWDLGLVERAVESDRSRITWAILLLFLGTSGHAATRAWALTREQETTLRLAEILRAHPGDAFAPNSERLALVHGGVLPDGLVSEYLGRLRWGQGQGADGSVLVEALRERARGSHDIGWLLADLMFKLGILGTVVGFIIMLGSVVEVDSLDIASLKTVLVRMSDGMRVALYTTFTGLVGGMLLALQYLLVDRAADRLVAEIVELGAVEIPARRQD